MEVSDRKLRLINWLSKLSNEEALKKLEDVHEEFGENPTYLDERQIESRLKASDNDIKYGRVKSQEEVEEKFKDILE